LEFLGTPKDYRNKGKVKISMFNNISEILAVLPPDIQGTAKIPSASHLFMTNEE